MKGRVTIRKLGTGGAVEEEELRGMDSVLELHFHLDGSRRPLQVSMREDHRGALRLTVHTDGRLLVWPQAGNWVELEPVQL